jgi:hypothetical protein
VKKCKYCAITQFRIRIAVVPKYYMSVNTVFKVVEVGFNQIFITWAVYTVAGLYNTTRVIRPIEINQADSNISA